MANTLITPTAVTRESLRILHQKLNFVGTIDRQYDDRFAKKGAKIGDTLQIRKPNQFVVRTGATLNAQDVEEETVSLQVATQKGVDMNFTVAELTMDMDSFSERYIEPAMNVLAANIENDAMNMYKDIWQEISDVGASATLVDVLNLGKRLTDSLCATGDRTLNLNTQDNVDLVSALSGLFNDQSKLGMNYREGRVASNSLGFKNIMENTLWPIHTTGTDDGTGDHLCTGVNSGTTINHGSEGSGTLAVGDIVTIDNVLEVHPETKASTGRLMRFVVTTAMSATDTAMVVSPAPVASGAKQNVDALPANTAKINKIESDGSTAIGASADYNISMAYHKSAFTFATADLIKPDGVDWCARQVLDGISMRIVRDYDINNDAMPCRLDVYYGYETIRPEMAVRLGMN
jgi:hypothetical protein